MPLGHIDTERSIEAGSETIIEANTDTVTETSLEMGSEAIDTETSTAAGSEMITGMINTETTITADSDTIPAVLEPVTLPAICIEGTLPIDVSECRVLQQLAQLHISNTPSTTRSRFARAIKTIHASKRFRHLIAVASHAARS